MIEKKKLCDMYSDSKRLVQKKIYNNIANIFQKKAQLHHLNNHSYRIIHLDLATQL